MRGVTGQCLAASLIAALSAPAVAQSPQDSPSGQLQTPDRSGTANLGSAASAPFHDLNLTRENIPPLLLQVTADPYRRPQPMSCSEISREVADLNEALGADFDAPNSPLSPSLSKKGGKVALAVTHGLAESLLPYAGFVRTLSGAQRHDQQIVQAIMAGVTRRGYLKGLGEARRCGPSATPMHMAHEPPPIREEPKGPHPPL